MSKTPVIIMPDAKVLIACLLLAIVGRSIITKKETVNIHLAKNMNIESIDTANMCSLG